MFKNLLALSALALAVFCSSARATILKATAEQTAAASVHGATIELGGRPFFPVMLIDECTATDVARARALGINLILNESCSGSWPATQMARLGVTQLEVLPIQAYGAAGGARLLGWTYPDEPENNGWTPRELAAAFPYRRGNPDGHLSFVTTTSAFAQPPFRDPAVDPQVTSAFARLADVSGFDLYPLNHCDQDLTVVYDAQTRFVQLAGDMPTFQWIETGPLKPTYCGGFTMTAAQLNVETWLAVAGGARGIGFFTHTLGPHPKALDVSPPVQHAIKRFSEIAAAVRPGLTGRTLAASSNAPTVKVAARGGGGRRYVFAVNSASSVVPAVIHVPRLANGALRVFGEERVVNVRGHSFADTFGPLSVHVYVESR